jgi:lauroyl/myristoyl acyltransferase
LIDIHPVVNRHGSPTMKAMLVPSIVNFMPLGAAKAILFFMNYVGMRTSDRLRILRNLKLAFGSEADDRFLFETMLGNIRHRINVNVDSVFLLNAEERRLIRFLNNGITVNGLAKLESFRDGNKGTILLSLHFGSFYLIPAALAMRGLRITALSGLRPECNRLFKERIKKVDEETGNFKLRLIPIGNMTIKSLTKALNDKQMVFLLGDFNMGTHHGTVKVHFMNRRIYAGYSAVWLHHKTGAPVVPLHVTDIEGHHLISIGDPLDLSGEPSYRDMTQRVFETFERQIVAEPEKWDRWKRFDEMLCDTHP